jgi:HK97 gp10 family phage protein
MAIEIEGLAELSQLLTEITPQAAKRYLGRCGDSAVQPLLAAMQGTVPVGVGILEEQLSYKKRFLNDGDETTLEVVIGPEKPAYWGSFQEFGTSTEPGQHWMSRAFESSKDEVLAVFTEEALALIDDLEAKKTR